MNFVYLHEHEICRALFLLQTMVMRHFVESDVSREVWSARFRSFTYLEALAHYAAENEFGELDPDMDANIYTLAGGEEEQLVIVDLIGEGRQVMTAKVAKTNREFHMVGSLVMPAKHTCWIYIQPVDIPQTPSCLVRLPN